MDWYTAATMLEKARQQGTDPSYFASHPIPYFENLFQPMITSPDCSVVSSFLCQWTDGNGNPYANVTQAVYDTAYTYNANDWTTTQLEMDNYTTVGTAVPTKVGGASIPLHHAFYQPQYGALTTWTTIGNSTYNAFAVSFRERMKDLTVDFNYTY